MTDWNRHGHWYVRLVRDEASVEFAIPSIIPPPVARRIATDALPGWEYVSHTWRADFSQRQLPSDSQPTFGEEFPGPASRAPWADDSETRAMRDATPVG